MQKNQMGGLHFWISAAIWAALITLLGCTQPQPQADSSMPATTSQAAKDKFNASSSTRIMARLDGLSGEADPRLAALGNRLEQLGFSIISMGVSAADTTSTSSPSAIKASQRSAFIIVAIDPAKTDMEKALAQFRATEAFAYVEADQLNQQRR